MEGLSIILGIISLIISLLGIVLFFKIWVMTDDISEMKKDLRNIAQQLMDSPNKSADNSNKNRNLLVQKIESVEYDKRLDGLTEKDKVKRKADGNIITVVNIGSGSHDRYIFCKIKGEGYKWIPKHELEYIY